MIKPVISKHKLGSFSEILDDLQYWMRKSPVDRIAAVEALRKQQNGTGKRLQRVIKVIKLEKR